MPNTGKALSFVEKARPQVTQTVGDVQLAEPKAVVLPQAQADLGA